MNERPEETIRRYLDESGGTAEVPFHNLLSTWQERDATPEVRQRIADDLAAVAVTTVPELTALGDNDLVELRAGDRDTARVAPPWQPATQAEQATAGRDRRAPLV